MTVSIFVISFSNGWSTMVNGRRGARHRLQVDATDEAVRLAAEVRRHGYKALISVQDRFGEIRPFAEPSAPSAPTSLHPIHGAKPHGFARQRDGQLTAELPSA